MSGPIVRTGTTPEYGDNWDRIFGGKASKKTGAKPTAKTTTAKATTAKATAAKATTAKTGAKKSKKG
jgi:hypothetical protein